MQKKSLSSPDEIRTFDRGKREVVTLGGIKLARLTYEPGWKWSISVKPIAKTESCQVPHAGYMVSGWIEGIMDDGTKFNFGLGDSFELKPGHDAWVVGDDPVIMLNIEGID